MSEPVYMSESDLKKLFSGKQAQGPVSDRSKHSSDDSEDLRKTAEVRQREVDLKRSQQLLAEREKELQGERQLNKQLKEQLDAQGTRIQKLEANEQYLKLEVKGLRDQNCTLDETNKRLTKHLDEIFDKQKRLITENQQVYNQYLEATLKLQEYHSDARKDAMNRSAQRLNRYQRDTPTPRLQSQGTQPVNRPRGTTSVSSVSERHERNERPNRLLTNSQVSHSTNGSRSRLHNNDAIYRPTIQTQIIHEFPPEATRLIKVNLVSSIDHQQKAQPSRGFSPKRIGRR